jgi:hypothetical protein
MFGSWVLVCCNGVDLWCFGGLLPDFLASKMKYHKLLCFVMTVQGSRKSFPAAQEEAHFTDGGCSVFECASTAHCLHLRLYAIYKEPMYKGK